MNDQDIIETVLNTPDILNELAQQPAVRRAVEDEQQYRRTALERMHEWQQWLKPYTHPELNATALFGLEQYANSQNKVVSKFATEMLARSSDNWRDHGQVQQNSTVT